MQTFKRYTTLFTKANLSKRTLSFGFTFVFALFAHAFAMLNLNLSHDYLNEFTFDIFYKTKIQSGRFFQPVVRLLLGGNTIQPWLDGIIGFIMISLAVYYTAKLFSLDKPFEIMVISCIFTVNATISTMIASCFHDFAGDMIALFFAVFAAYLWKSLTEHFDIKIFLVEILLVTLILATYQALISVTVIFIIFYLVWNLMNDDTFKNCFKKGLVGVGILLIGGLIYFLLFKLSFKITGIEPSNDYNSIAYMGGSISVKQRIIGSLLNFIWTFFVPSRDIFNGSITPISVSSFNLYIVSAVNIVLLLFSIVVYGIWLFRRQRKIKEKVLATVLLLVVPFLMNVTYILSCVSHYVTRFPFYVWYIFVLLLFCWAKKNITLKKQNIINIVAIVFAVLLVFNAARFSNTLYTKKDLESKATLSTMTRVLSEIERQEGYVYKETPVAFVGGTYNIQPGMSEFEEYKELQTGLNYTSSITYHNAYITYFKNVLQYPINICDKQTTDLLANTSEVESMPLFPQKGSVKMIDGVIVVKLGSEK